jgi:hypothetical protein
MESKWYYKWKPIEEYSKEEIIDLFLEACKAIDDLKNEVYKLK